MHVREWGAPARCPLVFWHALGAGTSGAYPTEIVPTLTDAGPKVHWMQGAGHDLFADAGPALGRIVADWTKRLPGRFARPERPRPKEPGLA